MNNLLNPNAEISIRRDKNKITVVMDESVYNMLVIECRFVLHKETFGKSPQEITNAIKSRVVIATLSQAPAAQELPTI